MRPGRNGGGKRRVEPDSRLVGPNGGSNSDRIRGRDVKRLACVLAFIFFGSGHIAAADEFRNVRCGGDISKALIGQLSSNERIVVTERKYRALGLKDLGAEEISD